MKGYILNKQGSLYGQDDVVGFGKDDFYIKEIDRDIANSIIIKNHYSKKFYSASYIHLGVYENNQIVGVLQFGYAMNPASQKSVVEDTEMDEYLELNRMWIQDDTTPYPESRAISYSIKYIKRKYPKIKWIQSFADERCKCFGIVYQAANFEYFGEHKAIFWTLDNVIYHNSLMTRNPKLSKSAEVLQQGKDRAISETLRQFRYIYFIDKRYKSKCKLKNFDYPKHYKTLVGVK